MKRPTLEKPPLYKSINWAQSIALIILAMSYYQSQTRIPVLVHDPNTMVSRVHLAIREQPGQQRMLHEAGFLQAMALATGSHPYQINDPEKPRISHELIRQFFPEEMIPEVEGFRQKVAQYVPSGMIQLDFNPSMRIEIRPEGNQIYLEACFTQTIPQENVILNRWFIVKALGHLTQVTRENTCNIKIAAWQIQEFVPQTHQ